MTQLLWTVPLLPLLSSLYLMMFGHRQTRKTVRYIAVGSVCLAAVIAFACGVEFLNSNQPYYRLTLWHWLPSLSVDASFYLDGLSLTLMMVVTGVGALIHLYASGYMYRDPDYGRFFCYLNLFLTAMLILVLADNLLLLYLGWEGVGLCSYLLIGFWHRDATNGLAARKAFIVTRVGDTLMLLGILLIFEQLGTLTITEILNRAGEQWPPGDPTVTLIALLLLGGAIGKSAQFPLHTWLPDAMAGPTPVSALIHAATMVTAGVYLIARLDPLYRLSPMVMAVIAAIGAVSILFGGLAALVQWDIKRILAYSTISQIGYMFLALGTGNGYGAIVHLVCHAFFKALLFLSAGEIIQRVAHKQNIFEMGGLYGQHKLLFYCFVIGSAALCALPLTAGYVSKEPIIAAAWFSGGSGHLLWLSAITGALLTAFYCTRTVLLVFFGPTSTPLSQPVSTPWTMTVSLAVLALLSLVGGYIPVPLSGVFLEDLQLPLKAGDNPQLPPLIHLLQLAAAPLAIALGWSLYGRQGHAPPLPPGNIGKLHGWLLRGMELDRLYNALLVQPIRCLADANRHDITDKLSNAVISVSRRGWRHLSQLQQGSLRHYAQLMAIALVLLLLVVDLMTVKQGG